MLAAGRDDNGAARSTERGSVDSTAADTPSNRDAQETERQQLTRNLNELLGELRVAQAGVQILFGFLLAVVFTTTFRDASGFEKALHLATVLLAVASMSLLVAPVAWHRVLFRNGKRRRIINVGNRLVVSGLVCLALAMTTAVTLIVKVVFGVWAMLGVGVLVGVLFAILWFLAPQKLQGRS